VPRLVVLSAGRARVRPLADPRALTVAAGRLRASDDRLPGPDLGLEVSLPDGSP
jgi:hypothetical protein